MFGRLLFRQILAAIMLSVALIPAGATPVTVRDIVAMQESEPPVGEDQTVEEYLASTISPDGHWFFAVTHRGNLATNRTEYRLLLFAMTEATDRLGAGGAAAKPGAAGREIAMIATEDLKIFNGAIRGAHWLPDSRHIVFIGEDRKGVYQIFKADIETAQVEQLTDVDNDILTYSYDDSSGTLLYEQRVPCLEECPLPYSERASFVVDRMSLAQTLFPDALPYRGIVYRFSVQNLKTKDAPKVVGAPFPGGGLRRIWLAPGGRWAIVELPVSDPAYLTLWKDIGGATGTRIAFMKKRIQETGGLGRTDQTTGLDEFALINLTDGKIWRLGMPQGEFDIGGYTEPVSWNADGTLAILGNTFAPAATVDGARLAGRPAVVALDPSALHITAIAPVTAQILRVHALDGGAVQVDQSDGTACYLREEDRYRAAPCGAAPEKRPAVQFSLRQDATTPPDIWATDPATGRSARVTAFNPQFGALRFGRLEEIALEAGDGKVQKAGLIYPVGFVPGRRYPLVIQTGGWSAGTFFIDGPKRISSAYPGQALAGRGMFVLQLPDGPPAFIEAAIRQTAARGLIDDTRVGIIGFSHTGVPILNLIAFSATPIQAAVIADTRGLGLFSYVSYFFNFGDMGEVESDLGAKPWGDTLGKWVAGDPSLHTDSVHAAMLFEQHGEYVLPTWDMYALLRRQQKPAEQMVFPGAIHLLRNPRQRFDELEANADWFDFWLQGREDPNPSKREQYARWERFCDQKIAEKLDQPAFCVPAKH